VQLQRAGGAEIPAQRRLPGWTTEGVLKGEASRVSYDAAQALFAKSVLALCEECEPKVHETRWHRGQKISIVRP